MIFPHQQVDGARCVLDTGTVEFGFHFYRIVQQGEEIVEPLAEFPVQLLVRKILCRQKGGVKAVPALDVRGGFLVIFPGSLTCLFQCLFP